MHHLAALRGCDASSRPKLVPDMQQGSLESEKWRVQEQLEVAEEVMVYSARCSLLRAIEVACTLSPHVEKSRACGFLHQIRTTFAAFAFFSQVRVYVRKCGLLVTCVPAVSTYDNNPRASRELRCACGSSP